MENWGGAVDSWQVMLIEQALQPNWRNQDNVMKPVLEFTVNVFVSQNCQQHFFIKEVSWH